MTKKMGVYLHLVEEVGLAVLAAEHLTTAAAARNTNYQEENNNKEILDE